MKPTARLPKRPYASEFVFVATASWRHAGDSRSSKKRVPDTPIFPCYLEAIALAEELEMRPLLARCHLGIGRLYLHAGDRDRAEDHLLTATRLFSAMDMPLWLRQTASSLRELGWESEEPHE